MRRHLYIAPKIISTEEKQIGFPEDVSFWEQLWSMFSKKADYNGNPLLGC